MQNNKPQPNQNTAKPQATQQPPIIVQAPPPPRIPIEPKSNPNLGDPANAPGTYPAFKPPAISQATLPLNDNGDPSAPRKADPLDQGVSVQETDEDNGYIDIEDELGGTGTLIFSGFLTKNDYNPDWTGWNRIKLIDEMRSSDATIQLGLSAVKYPILSARWYIKPGIGEDDQGKYTTFVKQELMQNPNFSFTHILRQALLYCEYGQMLFEKVFRKRMDDKIGWKKFAPRMPNTIFRYTMSDGITPGIVQILRTSGTVDIPMWKLLFLVLDMEGSNYEGRSLLRSAYQHYFYKKLYYKIDAIAAERQGCGIPVVHYPSQASPADKKAAMEYAQNLRVNEYAYSGLPTGFTVEWLDTKAKGLKDVQAMVLHHTRQELAAFRAQFLDLGATTAGSMNASTDQTELFYHSLNYIARTFQEPMNMAIKELVDLNFSNVKSDQYPTLEYANLGNTNITNYAKALLDLAQGSYITPDDNLEQHIRQTLELPEAMQFSDESYDDPENGKFKAPLINVTPPNDPTAPNQANGNGQQGAINVAAKPPIRYLNAEQRRRRQTELQWKENVNEMRELNKRIADAIDKKKAVV